MDRQADVPVPCLRRLQYGLRYPYLFYRLQFYFGQATGRNPFPYYFPTHRGFHDLFQCQFSVRFCIIKICGLYGIESERARTAFQVCTAGIHVHSAELRVSEILCRMVSFLSHTVQSAYYGYSGGLQLYFPA